MQDNEGLEGRRVLVVEDEMMIVMLIEDMLADLGCTVVGPAYGVAAALELVERTSNLDIALLDVNLAGQPVFAVADALRARKVPMIFCTGYGDAGLRAEDRGSPVLQKPYRAKDLADSLSALLAVS
jgi:CheY-like chemotaxis protein